MYRSLVFIVLTYFSVWELQAQEKDTAENYTGQKSIYPFIIQDAPARFFTMRQFNEDYLSGYRLFSNILDKKFSPAVKYTIQSLTGVFAFTIMTHEEGHRSILVLKNIGSVSQPFFFSERSGYVDGVSDSTLKNFRDTDFPDYARLHTAGLESDYMLAHREESLIAFEEEPFKHLAVEYLLRKAMIIHYYIMGLFKYDIDGDEETDELKRDIVGNDVYGVIRHLHRPTMAFHRYTRYNDLTNDEKNYLKKVGYRSLLNLLNPNIIGIRNFKISGDLKMNFGFGYTMCPFGDMIDQNLWFLYKNKIKLQSYIREFQNNGRWFAAGGIGLKDFALTSKFIASVDLHIWNQPENLGFNDRVGKMGGAIEGVGRYFILANQKTKLKALSIDLGFIIKSDGFLPEEVYMNRHFGIRFGTSFVFDH
jgi:hypothetical protein